MNDRNDAFSNYRFPRFILVEFKSNKVPFGLSGKYYYSLKNWTSCGYDTLPNPTEFRISLTAHHQFLTKQKGQTPFDIKCLHSKSLRIKSADLIKMYFNSLTKGLKISALNFMIASLEGHEEIIIDNVKFTYNKENNSYFYNHKIIKQEDVDHLKKKLNDRGFNHTSIIMYKLDTKLLKNLDFLISFNGEIKSPILQPATKPIEILINESNLKDGFPEPQFQSKAEHLVAVTDQPPIPFQPMKDILQNQPFLVPVMNEQEIPILEPSKADDTKENINSDDIFYRNYLKEIDIYIKRKREYDLTLFTHVEKSENPSDEGSLLELSKQVYEEELKEEDPETPEAPPAKREKH